MKKPFYSLRIFQPLHLLQFTLSAVLTFSGLAMANAASLRVSPIGAELIAPASTTTFRLRNDEARILHSQIRVFRWLQINGRDEMVATSEVVASPPLARLQPGTDYTIRVVRVSRQPITGEEAYRVVIDELPDPARKRSGSVELVVRHVLPLFFRAADATPAAVSWQLFTSGKGVQLAASNRGGTHLRIANLGLATNGRVWLQHTGLFGYVLAGSSMKWNMTSGPPGKGQTQLTAISTNGPYRADVSTMR